MKSLGIVRRIDDLGRVVIPKEIRRSLGIKEGDPMELFVADGGIFIKRYNELDSVSNRINTIINDLEESLSSRVDDDTSKVIQDISSKLKSVVGSIENN
jgi:stage V sporulation protein T